MVNLLTDKSAVVRCLRKELFNEDGNLSEADERLLPYIRNNLDRFVDIKTLSDVLGTSRPGTESLLNRHPRLIRYNENNKGTTTGIFLGFALKTRSTLYSKERVEDISCELLRLGNRGLNGDLEIRYPVSEIKNMFHILDDKDVGNIVKRAGLHGYLDDGRINKKIISEYIDDVILCKLGSRSEFNMTIPFLRLVGMENVLKNLLGVQGPCRSDEILIDKLYDVTYDIYERFGEYGMEKLVHGFESIRKLGDSEQYKARCSSILSLFQITKNSYEPMIRATVPTEYGDYRIRIHRGFSTHSSLLSDMTKLNSVRDYDILIKKYAPMESD